MSASFAIGLDMGGTKCAGVLLDENGVVVGTARIPTPTGEANVIDALATTAEALREQSSAPITALGVGVPGLITTEGVLRFAPHLPGVVELRLVDILRERLGTHVIVANDNTCATWGEFSVQDRSTAPDPSSSTSPASPDPETFVYVGFGTGIGGGVVANGQLLHGASGFAAEFGHLVVEASGPECVCGRRGCWEVYASGSGLARLARNAGLDLDGPGVRALLRRGSPAATAVVESFARWVAVGLTNLIFAYDPSHVVLGGGAIGLPEEAPELIEPILRHLALEFGSSSAHRSMPFVRSATLGPQAGAIGAALMARSSLLA